MTACEAPLVGLTLDRPIDPRNVEEAMRRATTAARQGDHGFAEKGLRLARVRHPLYMKTLEKAAEVMDKLAEEQYGYTRRLREAFAERVPATDTTLFREAFNTADRGSPEPALGWVYGAAAWLAGL